MKVESASASIQVARPDGSESINLKSDEPVDLQIGKWVITANAEGYEKKQKEAEIQKGKETEIAFKLSAVSQGFSAIEWKTISCNNRAINITFSPRNKYFGIKTDNDILLLDRNFEVIWTYNNCCDSVLKSFDFSVDGKYFF